MREFDFDKCYSAIDAEKVNIGDRCIFADSLYELKKFVCDEKIDLITISKELKHLNNEKASARFVSEYSLPSMLCYRVCSAKEYEEYMKNYKEEKDNNGK